MALPVSGPISLGDVEGEFGGAPPTSISEYYDAAAGVPSSGTIALSDFYGTQATIDPAFVQVNNSLSQWTFSGTSNSSMVINGGALELRSIGDGGKSGASAGAITTFDVTPNTSYTLNGQIYWDVDNDTSTNVSYARVYDDDTDAELFQLTQFEVYSWVAFNGTPRAFNTGSSTTLRLTLSVTSNSSSGILNYVRYANWRVDAT